MSIEVKSERVVNGGFVMSAHVGDWDLTRTFPELMTREIVNALTKRFMEEHGDAIMELLKPNLIADAVAKEVCVRVAQFIASKEEKKR